MNPTQLSGEQPIPISDSSTSESGLPTPTISDSDIIAFGRTCVGRVASSFDASNAMSFARGSVGRMLKPKHRSSQASLADAALEHVLGVVERANVGLPTGFADLIAHDPVRVLALMRLGVASLPGDDEPI